MNDIEKVVKYLDLTREEIGKHLDKSYGWCAESIENAIQTIRELNEGEIIVDGVVDYCDMNRQCRYVRELQEQIPKWHLLADGDFPKAEESVLLVAKHIGYQGKVYYNTFRGIYEDGTIHSEDSIWSWNSDYTDALEYCEETDDYIIGEGWYEESLYNPENMSYEIDERDKIIAWMELPKFREM